MNEQTYYVRLCKYFTDEVVAESDRMPYEEAEKTKEYLDRIFDDVYVTINPA